MNIGSLKLISYNPEALAKCKIIENRYVCSICIEIYQTIDELKLHYINVHKFKQKQTDTQEQKDFFSESSSADQSNSNQVPAPKESYFSPKICNICEMKFKNQKTLTKHVKFVHHKFKNLICQVCNKKFTRKSTLDIHARTHLSDDSAKILSCNVCSFKCSDPSVISKHKKIHQTTNEGKYKCIDSDCSYYASQATALKNHVLYNHRHLFYSKLKCIHCEFVSVNPERLQQHILNHEKGLLDKKEESQKIEDISKTSLNTSMEISSDCFLPIESTDSMHNQDQGGVTIIHNNSSTSNVHNEDAVF